MGDFDGDPICPAEEAQAAEEAQVAEEAQAVAQAPPMAVDEHEAENEAGGPGSGVRIPRWADQLHQHTSETEDIAEEPQPEPPQYEPSTSEEEEAGADDEEADEDSALPRAFLQGLATEGA